MAKRGGNTGKKRGVGHQKRSRKRFAKPTGNVSPPAVDATCDYCLCKFWQYDKRQRYHDPSRERKLAHQRRGALATLLYTLMPWRCGVTADVVRRMVEAAEQALLRAVRVLGWCWDETTKQFEWRAA